MRYVSTRGQAPELDFEGVLLAGLATDGGLYVPQSWPQFSAADWRAMRLGDSEFRIMRIAMLGKAVEEQAESHQQDGVHRHWHEGKTETP